MKNTRYIGRFAPTPSGGLHFGSLVAALASYLDAKSVGGQWFIRIEDIDLLREVPGASDAILSTLEAYGFEWDDEVLYQSKRLDYYQFVVDQLVQQGLAYACTCSRRQLEQYVLYPGFCRDALKDDSDAAIRLRVPELTYHFDDRLQGLVTQHLGREVGDFVIKRRDGFFAYQLAVVLDDAQQGVTDVVRGTDLLDSTPRQLYLQELLGLSTPRYLHIPTLLDHSGKKLSKSFCSPVIAQDSVSELLVQALEILGQVTGAQLRGEAVKDILAWAVKHWNIEYIPKQRTLFI